MDLKIRFPTLASSFQTNSKLFLSGGMKRRGKLSYLFSIDYEGRRVWLEPMRSRRFHHSLCGRPSLLIAVGGLNSNVERIPLCEQFFVKRNKWNELPPLCVARESPGSVLLQSLRAYCFCGDHRGSAASLEYLEMSIHETRWKTMKLDQIESQSCSSLVGVEYEKNVVVFGGKRGE